MKKWHPGMFGPHVSKEAYEKVRKAYVRKRRVNFAVPIVAFLVGFILSQCLGRIF